MFRSCLYYWLSALLYLLIGVSFLATVKRLCDYKEENFRLMEELIQEKQKAGIILCCQNYQYHYPGPDAEAGSEDQNSRECLRCCGQSCPCRGGGSGET